jgi:hypothetical protein
MKLPIIRGNDIVQLQTKWAAVLEPLLSTPMLSGSILKRVSLSTGSNTVNHGLARELQGWFIVRQRASATIYDTQDSNALNDRTLVLVSSANVVVDIFVF